MTTPLIEGSKPNTNELLVEALENRWKNYRLELKRCRIEFSNEAVHDLRVATRRMLALIQLLSSVLPHPRLQKLIRAFKDQLDEFDDLRDTQVILAELSEILQDLPQMRAFQKHLQYSEERMLRALRKKIKKLETSEMSKRVRKTHESVKAEVNGELESQIMQAVDDAFLRVKQRNSGVNVARSATIHRVRIAFKSLRYMVEIIHRLLQDFPTGNLKRMNDYQTLMGEIQDAEVFTQMLAEYLEHASLSDPEPVHHYIEHRHADAISAYIAEQNQLDTFWRSAPDQSFPWEKTK
jgi:CHAD domain-containing protein